MTRLLIDTDTAGDDVTSLLIGLRHPEVELAAITVCAGNVFVDQAVRNALITVETAERIDVPVHAGAAAPLLRPLVTAHYVHGQDGMGDCGIPDPTIAAHDQHAVDAIVDCADRFAGELEIIAQAPLTNIALALRKDPELPTKVKHLWIMGGANNFIGNITPVAEFNFYVDPEAAHAVLRGGFNVTLVPWDVCVHDGILMRDELDPIISMGSKLSEFYLKANSGAWSFVKENMKTDGISHPDAITIAMAIEEAIIVEQGVHFVDVEFRSELTRGYSVVDAGNVMTHVLDHGESVAKLMNIDDPAPNARVVKKADKARFTKMLLEILGSL